ncbi:hypothetical protein BST27_00690 [Mycobacterium intermedium]|uniref:Transposase for insertion sequence element IS21-like C-terminal domain-containing protein n=1 Tax=Mycobacterium intermedium TaxID=28445 RepID=A0A1E3SAQ5_MYCIE|nr:hypothetical protein BHQ20_18350 [Mycobacterium intermedium]ORB10670.1 hypothetical protein BST27_00690 [Mycobacterium intermedium]
MTFHLPNLRRSTTLNAGDQPPAEVSNQKVSELTGAVQFRNRAGESTLTPSDQTHSADQTTNAAPLSQPNEIRACRPIEIDVRVPPSGVVAIAGLQQLWVGKNYAGLTVTLWIDLTRIHVLLGDEVIKTVPSRVTTADLKHLSLRGVRPGRADPVEPAATSVDVGKRPAPVDIDRTASRDGIVVVAGRVLPPVYGYCRPRVALRFDGGLIHATAGHMLLKTLPNPFSRNEVQQLKGVRPAASPLPPPPPSGPQSVQRRVPKDGVIMVAGQRLRVGRTHVGTIVTVVVDDHHFRVLDGTTELSLHARTSTKPIRNFNAHRPRQR